MKRTITYSLMFILFINLVSALTTYDNSNTVGLCDSYSVGHCKITASKTFADDIRIKDFSILNVSSGINLKTSGNNFDLNLTNISLVTGGGSIFTESGSGGGTAGILFLNVTNVKKVTLKSVGIQGTNGIPGGTGSPGVFILGSCVTPPGDGGSATQGTVGGNTGKVVLRLNSLNNSLVYTQGGRGGNHAAGGDPGSPNGCAPANCGADAFGKNGGTAGLINISANTIFNTIIEGNTSLGGSGGFVGCGNNVPGGNPNKDSQRTIKPNKIINSRLTSRNGDINISQGQIINSTIEAIELTGSFSAGNINLKLSNLTVRGDIVSQSTSTQNSGRININLTTNIILNNIFSKKGTGVGFGQINFTLNNNNVRVENITGGSFNIKGVKDFSFNKIRTEVSGITIRANRTLQRGEIRPNSPTIIITSFLNKTASILGNPINITATIFELRNATFGSNVLIYDTFLKVYSNYTGSGTLKWQTNGTIRQFIPYWKISAGTLSIKFNYTKYFEGKLLFDKTLSANDHRFNWTNNYSKKVEITPLTLGNELEINTTSIDGTQNFRIITVKDRLTGIPFLKYNVTIDGNKFFQTINGSINTNISSTIISYHNLTFRGSLFLTKTMLNYDTSNFLTTNATFYKKKINVTAYNALTNAKINSFTAYVNTTPFINGWVNTTTTGSVILFLDWNKTSNVFVDNPAYALNNKTFFSNLNNISISRINMTLYPSNIVLMRFLDALTKQLITIKNITIEFVTFTGSGAFNFTTNTGKKNVNGLPAGNYVIRFSSLPYYYQSFYAFTLPPRGFANLTLYMANTSIFSIVTATVYDEVNHRVENAKIEVMKYDSSSGSYLLTEICLTNFEGQCQIKTILSNEFYKFNVRYNNILKFSSSNPTYIFQNTINFQITIGDEIGKKFYNLEGIDYSLVYNNATNNFRLDYTDSKGILQQACLRVEREYGVTKTLIQDKCNLGAAGTILIPITPLNDAKFTAVAYTVSSPPTVLDTLIKVFSTSNPTGLLGLFFIWLLTFVLPFLAIWKPPLAFILTPLPLLFGSAMGIVPISVAITIPLELLGLILAYFVSDRS